MSKRFVNEPNFGGKDMNPKSFSPKRMLAIILAVVGFVTVLSISGQLLETNDSGYYQVQQAAFSGDMSVRTEPGTYWQLFSQITTYTLSDEYDFSKDDNADEGPIKVQFNDGSTAHISGVIKFRLSAKESDQLMLHRDFKKYTAVKHSLIRQIVSEAVKQTANLMRAEESYSTRRSEFAALAEEQVVNGIYETESKIQRLKDTEGNEFIETSVNLKLVNGKPVVRKPSPLPRYNVEVLQFVIKDIDFDSIIENLISKKKEAEQQKVVARANAEKAKQDAITAREQGEAKIAEAKAAEEVKKIQAVVQAQKEYEVSVLDRKKVEETAKATLAAKKGEAEANQLLVKAGLTPFQRAEIERDTAIGVAKALAEIQLPTTFIAGGGSGGAVDPFTAIGLNQLLDISKKMARSKKAKAEASTTNEE